MGASDANGLAMLVLLASLFGFVLAVLWVLVPFAVFGIKPRLDRLTAEQKRTNALLEQLLHETQSRKQ